jgi:hypothetical protein
VKESIPEAKQMKGKVIPEVSCGLPKKLSLDEQHMVEQAADKIGYVYWSSVFGYPIRHIENIKKDLADAKQLLAQVKCPQVI